MGVLNLWQRLDRVLPGLPYGDGVDSNYSSPTIPTLVKGSISGTAASTALTNPDASFANGEVIFLIQFEGTGVGQWEINRVVAGGGTSSLTMLVPLKYTYTDSGSSQAQAVKVFRFQDVTVSSGTWTVPNWDGNVGGFFPFACKGNFTGTIFGKGTDGITSAGGTPTVGPGYTGGYSRNSSNNNGGNQGEGSNGPGTESNLANGNGGGAGVNSGGSFGRASGGGGGNKIAGTSGGSFDNGTGGNGGDPAGSDDMTLLVPGGAGGGGMTTNGGESMGTGASGSATIIGYIKNIVNVTGININGGKGGDGNQANAGGGGGSAGGNVLFVCQTATLGTNVITAIAGSGGSPAGGNGGTGRITVHHSGVVTGTTNPTFTDVVDLSLTEKGVGLFIL